MSLIFSLTKTIPMLFLIGTIILFIRNFTTKEKEKNIIKCPDCKHKVSIKAKTCPKCNREISAEDEELIDSISKTSYQRKYRIQIFLLNVLELIIGISIVFIFEWVDEFTPQLITLISLIINTLSIIIFNIKETKKRKQNQVRISIISILATLCGLAFSTIYIFSLSHKSTLGYESDIREIMYLEEYDKEEAEDLLDNIYDALEVNDDLECLELYGIWEDNNHDNTYYINLKETCTGYYLPVNSLKMEVDSKDETEVTRIYWQFNDTLQIDYYNNKQVHEFTYIYHASIYDEEPEGTIKYLFEKEVKEELISPSTAIFTYNDFYYFREQNRFAFSGWVESQNTYGAMIKKEFLITILPCNEDSCSYDELGYKWEWTS